MSSSKAEAGRRKRRTCVSAKEHGYREETENRDRMVLDHSDLKTRILWPMPDQKETSQRIKESAII